MAQPTPDPTSPGGIPTELEQQVAAILRLTESEQPAAFARLRAEHPPHAALLAKWERATQALGAPTNPEPEHVGPYRVLSVLGEGGMGRVYLAEQREPIRRRVALKVIKLGLDTDRVLARFDVERQSLALMNHDNIARVLDAGAVESGQPFFVMELVSGLDHHRLLRPRTARHSSAPVVDAAAVRRRPARSPKGRDSPRPKAIERLGLRAPRPPGRQDHRFRPGTRDGSAVERVRRCSPVKARSSARRSTCRPSKPR